MQIAELRNVCDLDTSDLNKMFGKFCSYIFGLKNMIIDSKHRTSNRLSINPEVQDKQAEAANVSGEAAILNFDPSTDFRLFHNNICSSIKNAIESEKSAFFHKDAKEIIYAMVSLADEVFLNMSWKGKTFWGSNLLEMEFFESQTAGEEIFRRIDVLLAERNPLSIAKAEIYLKMIALGFQGKFNQQAGAEKEIDSYRDRLIHFISSENVEYLSVAKHRIFQKEYSCTIPTVNRKLLPDASVITYYSAFFIFIFLFITTLIWVFETRGICVAIAEISSIVLQG